MSQSFLPDNPRIAIVGTGAVGGYYGGHLAQHYEVHFFARSDVDHIRTNGLRIDSKDGDLLLQPVNTSTLDENVGIFDLVIVALKTTQNATVAKQLAPLLHSNTIILVIQNGLNVEAVFHRHFPSTAMIGGLAFLCANKSGPGWIEHEDYGFLKLGNFHQATDATLEKLCFLFEESGITCSVIANLQLARWEKLVWNIPFAGLCMLHNCKTQTLLNTPALRTHVKSLMLEVIQTAQADGSALPETLADKMLIYTDKMVDYAPSTLLDLRSGNPIEFDALFQEPMRVAQAHKIDAPCLTKLVDEVRALTQQHHPNNDLRL